MSMLSGRMDGISVARLRGILSGASILGVFGTLWCLSALLNWDARPDWAIPAAIAVSTVLLGMCIARLLATRGIRSAADPAAAAAGKRIGIWFGIIFSVESTLIAISSVVLGNSGHALWIPVAIALIVGIHFLPLARVFTAPIYYATGIGCTIGTLACLPIANVALRLLCVGLVMTAVLWATAWLLLWHTRPDRA